MPYRTPITTPHTYHLLNRTVYKSPLFSTPSEHQRFLNLLVFYQTDHNITYSKFSRHNAETKVLAIQHIKKQPPLAQVHAFCLMPTHFHLVATQTKDNGISTWLRKVQSSYSSFLNLSHSRHGSLFQGRFKSIHLASDEIFLHVCRYTHLNPTTANLISASNLVEYPWNSFKYYVTKANHPLLSKQKLAKHFPSAQHLSQWTLDQADYQKQLQQLKQLHLE